MQCGVTEYGYRSQIFLTNDRIFSDISFLALFFLDSGFVSVFFSLFAVTSILKMQDVRGVLKNKQNPNFKHDLDPSNKWLISTYLFLMLITT